MNRIEQLQVMINESGGDCFLFHALGLEYVKIGQDKQAIIYFKKVLEEDANYVGTYYHLAKLYERLQEREKALNTYKEGMLLAKLQNNHHTYSELMNAMEELEEG